MSNHTRAPGERDLNAILTEVRRADARGRLLMFEVMHAYDRFRERDEEWRGGELDEVTRAIEAIRAHLFPQRG